MSVAVKICGLKDKEALRAAVEGGASYLGFLFVPTARQYITPDEARELLATLPQPTLCRFMHAAPDVTETGGLVLTALFLDATDDEIKTVCAALNPFLGLIQLHGSETPERVAEIKKMTGLPVMKAIHIATAEDFDGVKPYEKVADMLMFDTKVGSKPTGGTGKSFDWTLLQGRKFKKLWMLAGGLTIKNVEKAIDQSGASIIDLSSGVETDGKKDVAKIKELLRVCCDL